MLLAIFVHHFFTALLASSSLVHHIINNIDIDSDTLILYEKVHNLIENITMRQSVNMRLWVFIGASNASELMLVSKASHSDTAKMFYTTDYQVNHPLSNRRDYAAIFLSPTNDNRLENWLNASLKLPPDSIKFYVSQNDCRLNESELSEIMSKLWHSHNEIGFIYYISLCVPSHGSINTTTTTSTIASTDVHKSGGSDYGRWSQRNNYIINLFYYQPFYRHKSDAFVQQREREQHHQFHDFGRMEKINLINANGVNVEWMETNLSQAFHYFPFKPHKLNFNGYLLTVILFPSTMAYLRSDMNIFKRDLSLEALNDPYHHIDAYFGEDVEALLELRRLLNFNLSLSPTSDMEFYGFKLDNGSFNGALGDLISKRADFMSNACFVKDYLTDNRLEFTNAINNDKLCIVVRTAALVPTNKLVLLLFNKSVWILILITILSACLAHAILLTLIDGIEYARNGATREFQYKSFLSHLARKMRDDTNIVFRIIAIIFGVSHLRGFSHSSYIRFFLSICLIWSVVLTGAFTGLLYDVYTTPKSYPNIDKLEDLLKSKLEIHVRHPGLVTDIFGDGKDASTVAYLKKRLRVSNDNFLNQRIIMRGDIAALERYGNYDSENNKLAPRKEDGKSNLHFIAECPRSYTLAYLLPKRSIYIKPINWYINIFMQSGLTAKWQKDSKFYFKLERALKIRHLYEHNRVKINLQHLEMAFLILILGHIVSAAVFIMEMFCKRRK